MTERADKRPKVLNGAKSNIGTRREFLKSSALAAGVALLPVASSRADPTSASSTTAETLTAGWEHFRGALGGAWDVWRNDLAESTVWKPVEVPHCFNARDAVDPDQPAYEGPGWYRRKLQIRNPFVRGRTLLHFEGAGQKCEVFVGLQTVGRHFGGYDEFTVDITDAMEDFAKTGQQLSGYPLAVRCDNSRDPEMIPSSLNDFHRFGGLYRNVTLLYGPLISLKRVHIAVAMSDPSSTQVTIKAQLHNPAAVQETVQLRTRIFDPKGSLVHSSSGRFQPWDAEREISVFKLRGPQLWSPSQPALYRCEVELESTHGISAEAERFGCRYFEFVEHGPFKLNGKRLFLRGTQRQEDHAGVGAAMSDDLIRAEMRLIKEMGANFVGLAHHQQSRTVLEQCDELGLLALEEIPWSRGGLGDENYKQLARDMLRAMIDQHANHPSLILWGLANEMDWPGDFPDFDKERIRAFVQELADEAHQLDPSRPTFLRRCAFAKDLVDVYSPSIWAGWYHGPYTQYEGRLRKEWQTAPRLLHIEWGADSHARRHSEDPDQQLAKLLSGTNIDEVERERLLTDGQTIASQHGDWSETYACNLFDWHLKEQQAMPWLAGSAQWIFKDFSSPRRPESPIPYVNQKGLVERDLTLKEGYYVFQSYWTEKPMIHIYGHSWPTRWGGPDELKLVKVYSNCETVELLVNGVSKGTKRRNSQDFPAAGLHWLTRLNGGDNHLQAVGRAKGIRVQDSLDLQYQPVGWGPAARLELREIARDEGRVAVEARLLDGNNATCLDARNRVWFGLTGDGTLLDDTGTSTGSRCVELYNGRAQISLARRAGTSVVSVHSKSLPSVFLTVD
jgi:beta-galactosidase